MVISVHDHADGTEWRKGEVPVGVELRILLVKEAVRVG